VKKGIVEEEEKRMEKEKEGPKIFPLFSLSPLPSFRS
jgi:hypothetical protein